MMATTTTTISEKNPWGQALKGRAKEVEKAQAEVLAAQSKVYAAQAECIAAQAACIKGQGEMMAAQARAIAAAGTAGVWKTAANQVAQVQVELEAARVNVNVLQEAVKHAQSKLDQAKELAELSRRYAAQLEAAGQQLQKRAEEWQYDDNFAQDMAEYYESLQENIENDDSLFV